MLEVYRTDGATLYIPLWRIYIISQSKAGELDISVDMGEPEKVWYKASGFTILREGQCINGNIDSNGK